MLTVCNYHYIREDYNLPYPGIVGVTPLLFEQQLSLLKKEGQFITADDLVSNLKQVLETKENYILITFDDGLKEQFDCAFPILESLEIPAIFFINSLNHIERKISLVHKIHLVRSEIPTIQLYKRCLDLTGKWLNNQEAKKAHEFYRFDDSNTAELKYFLNVIAKISEQEKIINSIFDDYFIEEDVLSKLYMSTDEIKILGKKDYIGSHSHTHLPLSIYDKDTIIYELSTTNFFLEQLCDRTIKTIAYPYGTKEAVNEQVAEIAGLTGHLLGFTTRAGFNTLDNNPLLLNRFDCNEMVGGKNYKKHFLEYGN